MDLLRNFLLLTFFMGSLNQTALADTQVHRMLINKFSLSNCNDTKCIRVQAHSAESGNFSSLMSLKSVELKLTDRTTEKTVLMTGTYGYIDLDRNFLVIRINKNKEMSFDLSKITSQEFQL